MILYVFLIFWGENGFFILVILIVVFYFVMLCVWLFCDYVCWGSYLFFFVICRNFFLLEVILFEVIWIKGFFDRYNNFGLWLVWLLWFFCEMRIGYIFGYGVENIVLGFLLLLWKMWIVLYFCLWVKVFINIFSEYFVLCF